MTDHGFGEGSQPLLEPAFPVGRLGDAIVGPPFGGVDLTIENGAWSLKSTCTRSWMYLAGWKPSPSRSFELTSRPVIRP
jgi:hypothetical protein